MIRTKYAWWCQDMWFNNVFDTIEDAIEDAQIYYDEKYEEYFFDESTDKWCSVITIAKATCFDYHQLATDIVELYNQAVGGYNLIRYIDDYYYDFQDCLDDDSVHYSENFSKGFFEILNSKVDDTTKIEQLSEYIKNNTSFSVQYIGVAYKEYDLETKKYVND